jgi:capsular exopolysaccharide synthesis family protein
MSEDRKMLTVGRVKLVHKEEPFYIAEELKSLRTNLLFCGDDKRIIFATSCVSGEGKSTITLALARSLAELGKTVLLVDADMRKPFSSNLVLEGEVAFGLSHYLSGQVSMDQIIYATDTKGLALIGSGAVPPNPSELLSGKRFQQLFEVTSEVFDYIIVDCAPLGMVIDAAVIAPRCDGGIVIVEAGSVKYRFAQAVVQKLRATQTPILGVVLNKVDRKHGRNYGKYYGYGGAKYGYGGKKHKYGYGYGYGYGAQKYGYGEKPEKQ